MMVQKTARNVAKEKQNNWFGHRKKEDLINRPRK